MEPPHLYYRDSERLTEWTEKGHKKMQQASDEEPTWYEPFIHLTVVEVFPTKHERKEKSFVYIYIYMDICMYVCMYVYVSTYMQHIYICIYTYIYIYIHTYT